MCFAQPIPADISSCAHPGVVWMHCSVAATVKTAAIKKTTTTKTKGHPLGSGGF